MQPDIYTFGSDILKTDIYKQTKTYMQHGNLSIYQHSLNVLESTLNFVNKHNIKCNKRSLVRGILLHDFFLYDWHKKGNGITRLHAWLHPNTALVNAEKFFMLNNLEREIIRCHMWPITLLHMPRHKESWLIVLFDKYVALKETLHIKRGLLYV